MAGSLTGKRVLVTRARSQAQRTCELLRQHGADPICMPTIRIVPINDGHLERALLEQRDAKVYDYLILTSANAVRLLGEAFERLGCDGQLFGGVQVCAVGPGTAEALHNIGLHADLVPQDNRGEGVLSLLPARKVESRRVLLPRAEVAREVLPDQLRERGAIVDLIAVYRTELPLPKQLAEGRAALEAGGIDIAIFTSASTARNFAKLLGDDLGRLCQDVMVAAIGPVTKQACEEIGLQVNLMPESYTLPALVQALCAYFGVGGQQ